MASKKNQHVVPRGKGWAVVPAGTGGKPTSQHRTQGAAIQAAIPKAKLQQSEVVIHRTNGQIRDSDSYGNDPNPPRDKRH